MGCPICGTSIIQSDDYGVMEALSLISRGRFVYHYCRACGHSWKDPDELNYMERLELQEKHDRFAAEGWERNAG